MTDNGGGGGGSIFTMTCENANLFELDDDCYHRAGLYMSVVVELIISERKYRVTI